MECNSGTKLAKSVFLYHLNAVQFSKMDLLHVHHHFALPLNLLLLEADYNPIK